MIQQSHFWVHLHEGYKISISTKETHVLPCFLQHYSQQLRYRKHPKCPLTDEWI